MRTSPEYQSELKMYKREMSRVRKKLPRNWIKMIMSRRNSITLANYNKMYNDLVNIVNGRSYRTYLKRKKLVEEIIELTNHNEE